MSPAYASVSDSAGVSCKPPPSEASVPPSMNFRSSATETSKYGCSGMPACHPAPPKNARVYMIQGSPSLLLGVKYFVHSSSDLCTHHTTHSPQLTLHFVFQTAKTHTGTHTHTTGTHTHTTGTVAGEGRDFFRGERRWEVQHNMDMKKGEDGETVHGSGTFWRERSPRRRNKLSKGKTLSR